MSFLEKVKAVFIVPEQGKVQSEGTADSESQRVETASEEIKNVVSTPEDTSKFVKILSDALEKHNEPGFDYLEFRKALLAIKKLENMDESAQYKSAFAAAHAMNVTEDKLSSTAKKYLNVLEQELTSFQQTAKEFLVSQQNSSEEKNKRLTASIREKGELIAKLNAEMEEDKAQLSKLQMESTEVIRKVESNRSAFMQVYQQLVDQIKLDIQNMDRYLK